jgi:hypothetical protein
MIKRAMVELETPPGEGRVGKSADEALHLAYARIESLLDVLQPDWEDDPALIKAAVALSAGLTSEDAPKSGYVGAKKTAAAYLAYFAPRGVAALAAVWRSLGDPDPGPNTTVDLGAGSGAAALFLGARGAERVHLVDRDAAALSLAQRLLEESPAFAFTTRDMASVIAQPIAGHRVISAFSVGEWNMSPEQVLHLLERGFPGATQWILIDAGDKAHARPLQELRALALESGYQVLSPCPHQDACPALERARDYCHGRAPRALTPRLRRFAEATGRNAEAMAFSSLVLSSKEAAPDRPGIRVIGELKREKGRHRLPICGPHGLRFLQVLTRHKEAKRALAQLERGQDLNPALLQTMRDRTAHATDPELLRPPASEPDVP